MLVPFLSSLDWNIAWSPTECHFFSFGSSYDSNLVSRECIEIAGRNRKWIIKISCYHMREFFIISKNGISDNCYGEMHANPAITIQIFPLK